MTLEKVPTHGHFYRLSKQIDTLAAGALWVMVSVWKDREREIDIDKL